MNEQLRNDYRKLWSTMKIESNPRLEAIVDKIFLHKFEYDAVASSTGVPWYVVACIHYMEGGLNFKRQLFNGQFYYKKTTLVPAGLGPWDSWFDSARESMYYLNKQMRYESPGEWNIVKICYTFENHNGWGYRKYHSHVKSPYLWSQSNHYIKGKYVADGKWDEEAISKQLGAMVIIKALTERIKESQPVQEPEPIQAPVVIPEKPEPPKPKKKPWWKFWKWFC